jgi:general secretion pathway protein I
MKLSPSSNPSSFPRRRRVRGFTLLEVMIALLVITLGMGAVINTTTESSWKSSILKQKTIAGWVAQNQMALYRAKQTWTNTKTRSGDVEMANVEWSWELKVTTTDDPSLRRLDIDVSLKGEDAIAASFTGFIAKP